MFLNQIIPKIKKYIVKLYYRDKIFAAQTNYTYNIIIIILLLRFLGKITDVQYLITSKTCIKMMNRFINFFMRLFIFVLYLNGHVMKCSLRLRYSLNLIIGFTIFFVFIVFAIFCTPKKIQIMKKCLIFRHNYGVCMRSSVYAYNTRKHESVD